MTAEAACSWVGLGDYKALSLQIYVLYSNQEVARVVCYLLAFPRKVALVAPCVLCEHAFESLPSRTWPVGRLPPTLMCICWSVVGSGVPGLLG